MKTASLAVLLVGAVVVMPASSYAAITNGSFAAGLTAWSAVGNVAVDTSSSFGPPASPASTQAVLGTAAASSFLFGGAVTAASNIETALGLPATSLSGVGATVGSAMQQTFTANAGDRLTFSWNFMTDEPQNAVADDMAFLVVDGVVSKLATVKSATLRGSSLSPLLDETGYQGFLSASLSAGAHTIGFGIVDIPDQLGASAFAVTNVALAAVPEPSTWACLGAGLIGLLVMHRRTAAISA